LLSALLRETATIVAFSAFVHQDMMGRLPSCALRVYETGETGSRGLALTLSKTIGRSVIIFLIIWFHMMSAYACGRWKLLSSDIVTGLLGTSFTPG
jgi:hypothetical protein